jgi:Spy/CpxP family protein refolding chaperone
MKKQILTVLLTMGLLAPFGAAASFVQDDSAYGHEVQMDASPKASQEPGLMAGLQREHGPALFMRLAFLQARQDELNISDEQLRQVEELTFQLEEIRIEQQSLAAENRLALKKLMLQELRDYGRIEALMNQTAENRNAALVEGMKIREQIESVFSPEQMEALREAAREEISKRRPLRRAPQMGRLPRSRGRIIR